MTGQEEEAVMEKLDECYVDSVMSKPFTVGDYKEPSVEWQKAETLALS
jgi:hypothetical protein